VDVAFGVIALVGCALAAWAGLRMGERIEAADEAQRRLFENVSHELKTPLAAARGYAEAVQEGVMPADEAAQGIVRETDRMARLVDQILGLARLDAGAVVLRPERVELADFVQDCLMPLEGAVRAKGLQVELELAPGEVELDPELMGHALENVLSNAVRHAERLLRVSFDGQALVVANDGTMPRPEDVDHLFDRFRTSEGGSTGLGLAIAREVVELHGWQLSARLEGELLCVSFQVRA
jgi:signal transduction histidine kinase